MSSDRNVNAVSADDFLRDLSGTPEDGDDDGSLNVGAGASRPSVRPVSSTLLVKQRNAAVSKIRRLVKACGSLEPGATDVDVIEQMERLDLEYDRFCAAHEGILQVTGKAELAFQRIEHDAIKPVYEDGKSTLERYLVELRKKGSDVNADSAVGEFKKSRELAKSRIVKLHRWLSAGDQSANASAEELNVRMEHLQEMWTVFYSAHGNVVANLDANPCDEQHEMDEVEEMFFSIKSRIRRIIAAGRQTACTERQHLSQPAPARRLPARVQDEAPGVSGARPIHAPGAPFPVAAVNEGQQMFRLPTIELPRFGGNYAEWTSFRDRFMCLIGSVAAMSNVHKLHYLKSCVDGEAATLVRAYPITDRNFAPAWAALVDRYDNTRLVVNTHLQALFDAESTRADSASSLRALSDIFAENVSMLAGLNEPTDAWDSILVFLAAGKLDIESAQQWETSLPADARPSFRSFQRFVEVRCRALEAVERNRKHDGRSTQTNKRNPFGNSPRAHATSTTEDGCVLCSLPHRLYACQRFVNMSVLERKALVAEKRLCFNCLCPSHLASACTRSSCRSCQQRHHTLLHAERNAAQAEEVANAHIVDLSASNCEALLATANVLVTGADGAQHVVRALIDSAATSSFITEDCVQRLRLPKSAAAVPVTGIGQTSAGRASGIASVKIGSELDGEFSVDVRAYVLKSISAPLPARRLPDSVTAKFADVRMADPMFHIPRKVDLLLGARVFEAVWRDGTIPSDIAGPCAKLTVFGWVAIGASSGDGESAPRPRAMLSVDDCVQLDEQVKKFWEIEEVPRTKPRTAEETECERHYELNTTRDTDGRYVVRLPFASTAKPLGQSRSNAVRSMLSLEKRFRADPRLKEKYVAFMRDYEQMNHMERARGVQSNAYYLPHLAVVTQKMRVVFDASRRTSSGASLNTNLMAGPKLQDDLLDIALRFRCRRVALTGDIAKMYRQIRMSEDDRDFQRILWREKECDVLREYRLSTVTYGTTSAPFLAVRTLLKLAEDEGGRFPRAARVLSSDFYVDDLMTGCDEVQEAAELRTELDELLAAGGFALRKWATSHTEALMGVPTEYQESLMPFDVGAAPFVKTLGLYWCPGPDEFRFRVTSNDNGTACHTKRTVLSDVSKLFDPLGLLTPVVIVAKIFVQSLWKETVDWDEELRRPLSKFWCEFRGELDAVQSLRIPRWVGTLSRAMDRTELHGFCDASEKAYCAILFVRTVSTEKAVTVRVLTAKSRVAPTKQLTVPRLELCGAHLLGRLLQSCRSACGFGDTKCFLWTDSELVLWYLSKQPAELKTFVRHRVSDILESTQGAEWRHVSSCDNPADIGSRGVMPSALWSQSRWWNGPVWLSGAADGWPAPWNQKTIPEASDHELRRNVAALLVAPAAENWCGRYSDLPTLLRVTAIICRFTQSCRDRNKATTGPISAAELSAALDACARMAQTEAYEDEMLCCASGRAVSARSEIASLAPYLDTANVLRVGGRLQNAALGHDQTHQIILPPKAHLSRLLIWDAHVRCLHGGVQLTMATLRQRFWMVGMRRETTRIIHACIRCFRWRQRNRQHQIMGSLPKSRVTPNRAFLVTGVDFAGPMLIKSSTLRGSRTQKAYVSVFVCFSTRAIHLELVSDLTSAAFIAALHRFVSRRGRCAEVHSDCGTNFVGANAELRAWRKEVSKQIADANPARVMADLGTEWRFIPPGSPTFGGLWESAVKSTKHHLRRVLTDSPLTFEGMTTLLAQIEACLNSRPICAMSDNIDDLSALTPGHFLIGEPLNAIPHPDLSSVPANRLTRWQHIQQLVQHFWGRWQSEYMTNLQTRAKWRVAEPDLGVGDLVLMVDEQRAPTSWPLGRVEQVFPGADGHVRVASVRTAGANGSVRRTVRKLCRLPLPVDDD